MLAPTPLLLRHGQYTARLKTRMVGYIPKVVPRKVRGAQIALRSEANTAYFEGHLKTTDERLDNTGKKLQRVMYDPVVGRYTVFKETKIKGPFLTKQHIQKKVTPL